MNDIYVFGGSGITLELFQYIHNILPSGKTIVELGSGDVSTRYLAKDYRVYSVEDKPEWIGKHPATYIHAPLVNGWYDTQAISRGLPKNYDLILVDGPTGEGNRIGFLHNLGLFNTNVPIIFDDTNRKGEAQLVVQVAEALRGSASEWFETFAVVRSFKA